MFTQICRVSRSFGKQFLGEDDVKKNIRSVSIKSR